MSCLTRWLAVALLISNPFFVLHVPAQPDLVSMRSGSIAPPASGGGDSGSSIITPDGKFVVFASTANNLVLTSSNTPFNSYVPSKMNVFVRNRTHATTRLISVNAQGKAGGNGDSMPVAISTNGNLVLFESEASDLVPGDTNGISDLFLRNLDEETTTLVTVSTNGGFANGRFREALMTPDGVYAAFISSANNLVPDDTNGINDVFVRNLRTGETVCGTPGTVRGVGGLNDPSDLLMDLQMTPDAHYVVFVTTEAGVVWGAPSANRDLYLRDMWAGATYRVSEDLSGIFTNLFWCESPLVSDDGAFIAFKAYSWGSFTLFRTVFRYSRGSGAFAVLSETNAPWKTRESAGLDMSSDGRFVTFVALTNVTPAGPAFSCVYLWDGELGTHHLVSVGVGDEGSANQDCQFPVVSDDGRFVAFLSTGTNLTTNAVSAGDYHMYIRDVLEGTTQLVDAGTNGLGISKTIFKGPEITRDGRYIALDCSDADLVPGDWNRGCDVFVRDLRTTNATELISVRAEALPSLTPNGETGSGISVSRDGRYVAYTTKATDIVASDTNANPDVMLGDLLTGTDMLVSVGTNGMASSSGSASTPILSDDGRYVAFSSRASSLVAGDMNGTADAFVRDTVANTTTLVSTAADGNSGNGYSYVVTTSPDARYVVFSSFASTLVPGFPGTGENLFVRDMLAGTTRALTTNGYSFVLSSRAAVIGMTSQYGVSKLLVWHPQVGLRLIPFNLLSSIPRAISPDGQWMAFEIRTALTNHAIGIQSTTTSVSNIIGTLSPVFPMPRVSPAFNEDGRYFVYAGDNSGSPPAKCDIYVYDVTAATNSLISRSYVSGNAGDGISDMPIISPDGRFVCYRSRARDLVPGITNGSPQFYLYDRQTGITTHIAGNPAGVPANFRIYRPVFSGDSRTLFFLSWASDLSWLDFNQTADVFSWKLVSGPAASAFVGQIVFAPGQNQDLRLTWPAEEGKTYQVQFKNHITDAVWQPMPGSITITNGQGEALCGAPAGAQRFYRIRAN